LIRRALEGPPPAAAGALEALGEIGPPVLRYEPEFVWRVLRREPPGALFPYALSSAIGSIGRDDGRLLEIILDYARPRPPRIVSTEGGHDWDATASERGIALELLANFTAFPQRVVPVLMDALETFEEYDPDWSYERHEHGRVIASLRAFGPAAAPAVPVLARHLKTRDGDWDREVILLLGELGPLAAEALSALEQLRAESDEPTPTEPDPTAEPDKTIDPLDWSIWRTRHGHPR
jgi:hypothetical protein